MADSDDDNWSVVARRDFLRLGLGAGAAALLASCERGEQAILSKAPQAPAPITVEPPDDLPQMRMPDGPAERRFFGDDFDRFHTLWDKSKAITQRGGLPTEVSERTRVCIVGAGLSGLS